MPVLFYLYTGETALTNVSYTRTARDVSSFGQKRSAAGGRVTKDIALHLVSQHQVESTTKLANLMLEFVQFEILLKERSTLEQ